MFDTHRKSVEAYLVENQKAHYRYIYGMVKNPADAMDILQDSIVKALKKCRQLEDIDKVKPWFYRVMTTTTYDFMRKQRRQLPTVDEAIEHQTKPHYDTYEDLDLDDALSKLSFYEQTILRLKYFEEMTFVQIASIMDENVNTIKTKLYKTLKELRIALDEEEIGNELDG
jgi:RNA polymerase sigma-70 factor (ECF subfamily)